MFCQRLSGICGIFSSDAQEAYVDDTVMQYVCLILLTMFHKVTCHSSEYMLNSGFGSKSIQVPEVLLLCLPIGVIFLAYSEDVPVCPPPEAVWEAQPGYVSAPDPQRVWDEYSGTPSDSCSHSVWLWDVQQLLQPRPQRLNLQTGKVSEGSKVYVEVI